MKKNIKIYILGRKSSLSLRTLTLKFTRILWSYFNYDTLVAMMDKLSVKLFRFDKQKFPSKRFKFG